MFDNKTFYPTPSALIQRMLDKVQGSPDKVLEPSAGKGNIIEKFRERFDRHCGRDVSAIEIDSELRACLRGKGIKVIDTDFLTYSGPDKYDLIIANPPFDDGELHLIKAIDIMYRGEIVFLLNAETIRNPYTNSRKDLASKLDKLGAEIEFIQGAFQTAERPTGVEVALVYINIKRNVEDDLFAGADDKISGEAPRVETNYEVSTRKTIAELVAEYNQTVRLGTETILGYYRNYRKIGKYIGLNKEAKSDYEWSSDSRRGNLTGLMQGALNDLLKKVRIDFWRRTLDLKEVRNRMTAKKMSEFETQLQKRCDMDFTENNIRSFVLNLIGTYEQTLTEAVMEVFDQFTIKHCYADGLYNDNIHLYNGWKTNKAFKINKKVILPVYGGYGKGPFCDDFNGKWKLQFGVVDKLRDIDVVMNYFDGMSSYLSIGEALDAALDRQESRNIESTYFNITVYKKGTIHLTFKNEDILRRFNVVACRGKGWLPGNYGKKAYADMDAEEQAVVESFEGVVEYNSYIDRPLFAMKNLVAIEDLAGRDDELTESAQAA